MAGIAVQTAVGEIGAKATTTLSLGFHAMVNCGRFQYGLNGNGIYQLNSGATDAGERFTKTVTLVTSDLGSAAMKRIRFIYAEIETEGDLTLAVAVRPNKGAWISKDVAVIGSGLQTVKVSIDRQDSQGNLHAVRLSSTGWFRLHNLVALINDRRESIKRG